MKTETCKCACCTFRGDGTCTNHGDRRTTLMHGCQECDGQHECDGCGEVSAKALPVDDLGKVMTCETCRAEKAERPKTIKCDRCRKPSEAITAVYVSLGAGGRTELDICDACWDFVSSTYDVAEVDSFSPVQVWSGDAEESDPWMVGTSLSQRIAHLMAKSQAVAS